MVDPGPTEEGGFLNLIFCNPEKDSRIGKKRTKIEREKTNSTLKKKKETFIAVILVTEKSGKLPRCPIDECPYSQYSNTTEDY